MGLWSAAHTWLTEFESQTVLQFAQNFIIVLIICIFFLTFLEPIIHDSKYGDKRYNNNATCLVNLNKRAKLILPNFLVDWSNLTVIDSAYLLPPWHFIWIKLYQMDGRTAPRSAAMDTFRWGTGGTSLREWEHNKCTYHNWPIGQDWRTAQLTKITRIVFESYHKTISWV